MNIIATFEFDPGAKPWLEIFVKPCKGTKKLRRLIDTNYEYEIILQLYFNSLNKNVLVK